MTAQITHRFTRSSSAAIVDGGRHPNGFIIFHTFLYVGVRDLVCWLEKRKEKEKHNSTNRD
jgi:hypothetical protein